MDNTLNTAITSSPMWTSDLIVQGHQRINVSIRPGTSDVQDPTLSVFSADIRLQRKLPGDSLYRDVQSWSVVQADGLEGGQEVITASPEPETAIYRLGAAAGEYYAGAGFVRLGTS